MIRLISNWEFNPKELESGDHCAQTRILIQSESD